MQTHLWERSFKVIVWLFMLSIFEMEIVSSLYLDDTPNSGLMS